MEYFSFIRKIKIYSILSGIIPVLAIGLCLLLYKNIGSIKLYPDWVNWGDNQPYSEWNNELNNTKNISFTNCPETKIKEYYLLKDEKELENSEKNHLIIKKAIKDDEMKGHFYKKESSINKYCIKNKPILNKILTTFPSVEIFLIKIKLENESGFSEVKNPFLFGEVSISRTARYFPANFIFKPLIILGALFLFLYWKNNLNLFSKLEKENILNNFSKKFFYFGSLSCIFLIFHAIFLGLDFDSKFFLKMRRFIIIFFILFEVFAQIFLTKNLYKYREELKKYINPIMLKIKIAFVIIVFFTTCVAFAFLYYGEPSTEFKHILEWNYFSFLLLFYFLSRLLWK